MKQQFLFLSLLIGLLAVRPESSPAADKIRISVTNFNMSFLPSGLAVKRGFFREEGIEAEIIRMNANVAINALASGDTDYTMIFGSVVRAAIRGLPINVVASFIDGSTHALITRPEFKTAKDLKGKTLGIQAYGATDQVAAIMMLKHLGVDAEKDIKFVALGSAAGTSGRSQGRCGGSRGDLAAGGRGRAKDGLQRVRPRLRAFQLSFRRARVRIRGKSRSGPTKSSEPSRR